MMQKKEQNANKTKRMIGSMKWGDFLVIGITLVLCTVLWGKLLIGFREIGQKIEIVAGGKIILRYDLATHEKNYQSPGLDAEVESFSEENGQDNSLHLHLVSERINFDLLLQDGQVRFAQSDCPDQVCVHTGFISRPGQVAACVPAQVLVRITGTSASGDIDVTIR